ncbi:MAG: tRNA preQ1(34) S-adenosylmethionine ribosyltransferase-isomerase QueA [Lentisphaeria bacterium]|nr:tRNA preQ1(34) S-adenosylmethionine ribosyltransferase-isomerase QueA [Lentisphaeria bacterium]
MLIDDFDYQLPAELIAQEPLEKRSESRMMILDPMKNADRECPILTFSNLPSFLQEGDAIVFNDTKVIPARLFARKDTGAKIEILLLSPLTDNRWKVFMRNAKRVTPGMSLQLMLKDGETLSPFTVSLVNKEPDGSCIIDFPPGEREDALAQCGHLPLPPYIKRTDTKMDSERYQTVYANIPGAVAAPTAGLHFTPAVIEELKNKGVEIAKLTLHVGAGTFKPVDVQKIEDHVMHAETYMFPEETAALLNRVRKNGKRILAVGTTSLRTLESCVDEQGVFHAATGDTSIFIYPPYRIKSADMLLTNFHLPKSTLLMLVSAFAGMETVRSAYQQAIQAKMRFFSYGDCMLIQNKI